MAVLELPVDRRRDLRALRMAVTSVAALGLALMLGAYLGWLSTDMSAEDVAEIAAIVESVPPDVVEHDLFHADPDHASELPGWQFALLGDDRTWGPSATASAEWHSFVPDEAWRAAFVDAAERGLVAAGWDVVPDDGDPQSLRASKDGVTVWYGAGMTYGRSVEIFVERPWWTIVAAMLVLPPLVVVGVFAFGRAERRLTPRRQRLSLGLSLAGSLLALPSASCAPTPFADAAWSAGRLYDLRLGLMLNLGVALWGAAIVVVAAAPRQSK